MRTINLILIIAGQLFWSCNGALEPKVVDVELVSVKQTDSVPEPPPPPPPPPPNFKIVTFNEWLSRICETEKPDQSIIAYHFGLIETENGYSIYLIGSKKYDKEKPDWAANSDFEPSLKYYPLPISEYKNLKSEEVLIKIKSKLKDFTKTEKFKKSFFAGAKAITTGFDDGDLVKVK